MEKKKRKKDVEKRNGVEKWWKKQNHNQKQKTTKNVNTYFGPYWGGKSFFAHFWEPVCNDDE